MDKHGAGWLGSDSTNDAEHQALANMTSAVERRVEHMHELIEQSFTDLRAGIRDDISAGFEAALRNVAKDSDFARPFWQHGFDEMVERAHFAKAYDALAIGAAEDRTVATLPGVARPALPGSNRSRLMPGVERVTPIDQRTPRDDHKAVGVGEALRVMRGGS